MAPASGLGTATMSVGRTRVPAKLACQGVTGVAGIAKPTAVHRVVERMCAVAKRNRVAARAAATMVAPAGDAVEEVAVRTPWWLKDPAPNMSEVHTVQELVDGLAAAGDKLVVLDFYAPWCGACKALYPKLRRICEENEDIVMLKINLEESKQLCKTMGIKVLPYFHVYRGSQGRLAAFSASVAKIQRLRDAIAEHNTPRCFIGQLPSLPEFPDVRPAHADAAQCLSAYAKATSESTTTAQNNPDSLSQPSTPMWPERPAGVSAAAVESLEHAMQCTNDGAVGDLAAAAFALPSSIAAAAALPTRLDIPQQRLSPSRLHSSAQQPELAAV